MRHIRRLADKGKEKDDECDLLEVEAELCDEEDELEGCSTDCLEVFSDMQSLCPAGGKRAAVAEAALKECGTGDVEATAPAAESTPEPSPEVEEKCMPIMIGFVLACKADQPPPENPKDTFCVDECQSSIKELLDSCSEMLPPDAADMLTPLISMCSDGCLGHIMDLGMPGSGVAEACGIDADLEEDDDIEKGCDAGCKPTLCGIASKCNSAEDLGIPGLTDDMLSEVQSKVKKATEECACE